MRLLILFLLVTITIAQEFIRVNRTELLEVCRDSIMMSRDLVQQLNEIIKEQKTFQAIYYNRIITLHRYCMMFPDHC